MAMFSNFDGTMRKSIVIGKGGASLTSTGTSDLAVSKRNPDGSSSPIRITNIAAPIADADAVNMGTLNAKFGTTDTQVRNNLQLDGRYEQLGRKNLANGYVGLGADGKIESKFLPSIAINTVIVAKNKYARNKVTTLHTGDTCVIQGTPIYNPAISYNEGSVVRRASGQTFKFYQAKGFRPVPSFYAPAWDSNTNLVGALPKDTIILYNNVLYKALVDIANYVPAELTDTTKYVKYDDLAIPTFAVATDYPINTFVRRIESGVTKFYRSNRVIQAMPDDEWETTTIKQMWPYVIGDEIIHNGNNYIVIKDHTSAAVPDPTDAIQSANYVLDNAPDAGLYILTRTPTGVGGATVDDDWAAIGVGLSVETFNGRSGQVVAQTGDYGAYQVTSLAHDDLLAGDVQKSLNFLADSRVKKAGDTMSGTLVLAAGSVTAPALAIPSSLKTGVYDDAGRWAISHEGVSKWSVGANVDARTNIYMNGNAVKQLAEPQEAGDAATKKYVDDQPTILKGPQSPALDIGKEGDVYLTVVDEGPITLPSTQQWVDGTTDGTRTIFINSNAIPVGAVTTDGGITWANTNMPAASASSGDQYSYIVSNNTDNFVAIRRIIDMTKSTGKIVYTVDGGKTWNQSSKFAGSGTFIPASSAHDGSPYMLVPLANSNKVYTSNTGDSWDEILLPYSSTWADAAGARGTFVIVARDPAGTNKVIYQEFGGAWQQATTATTQVWNAIGTPDGVNFAVVGEKSGAAKDTNIANFSSDRGATWTATTLPSSGRWTCIGSNGTTMVTLRSGSNQGAYSTDNGRTWTAITLPSTRGWSGVFASSRAYYAIANDTTTNTPIAVSTDGGRTWTANVQGQITSLGVKQNSKWLNFSGIGSTDNDGVSMITRFVRRDGDKMTGALVISHDPAKESLTASGAISTPTVIARKFAQQNATNKEAGAVFIGTSNSDAASEGKSFGYTLVAEGNMTNGFALKIKSNIYKAAGSTISEIANITDSTVNILGNVGIGKLSEASTKAALAVSLENAPHGVVIHHAPVDSSANIKAAYPALTLVGGASGVSKLFVIKGSALDRIYDVNETAPYHSAPTVFTVDDQGIADAALSFRVGYDTKSGKDYPLGRIQVVNDTNAAIKHGIYLEHTSPYADGCAGLTLKHGTGWAANSHHIRVFEDANEVFGLNNVSLRVNKNFVLKSATPKNVSFYNGATDAMKIPSGTTAQRPGGTDSEPGMIRYNSTIKRYEAFVEVFGWTPMDIGVFAFTKEFVASNWFALTETTGAAGAADPLKPWTIDSDYDGITHYMKIPATEHKLQGNVNVTFQTKLASGILKGTNYDYIMMPNGDMYIYAIFTAKETPKDGVLYLYI